MRQNHPRHAWNSPPPPWRWLTVLLISLLLHALLFGWISERLQPFALKKPDPTVIIAHLEPIQAVPVAPPAPAPEPRPEQAPKPKPKPRPKPKPKPAAPTPAPVVLPMLPSADHDAALVSPADADAESVAAALSGPDIGPDTGQGIDAGAAAPEEASKPEPAGPEPLAQAEPALPERIDAPASVSLRYDVQALHEENIVYGSGRLDWRNDGQTYTIEGKTSVLFFTLLSFKSSGVIDAAGIAPRVYLEKRIRRAQVETRFDTDDNAIHFSTGKAALPRRGGEQDRASIIWQLIALGRANGERFAPGMTLDFMVAGTRSLEPWTIRVAGQEQIEVNGAPTLVWRLARAPVPGKKLQLLDIWLDPTREWYPVKMRFTEADGEYVEMLMKDATLAQEP